MVFFIILCCSSYLSPPFGDDFILSWRIFYNKLCIMGLLVKNSPRYYSSQNVFQFIFKHIFAHYIILDWFLTCYKWLFFSSQFQTFCCEVNLTFYCWSVVFFIVTAFRNPFTLVFNILNIMELGKFVCLFIVILHGTLNFLPWTSYIKHFVSCFVFSQRFWKMLTYDISNYFLSTLSFLFWDDATNYIICFFKLICHLLLMQMIILILKS